MKSEDASKLFQAKSSLFESLADEAKFSVESELRERHIKTHAVFARVKERESFLEKIERKGYEDPFVQMPDIVGLRIVCLFLSDLDKIKKAIFRVFTVLEEENKVETEDVASFGYMSIHFVCTLGPECAGPRYDTIKDLSFEIQVRTIVMDAWANVSHYLSYKGEASIPQELRRDFHALSGLFYVADQHFELFVRDTHASENHALEKMSSSSDRENLDLNADTLHAFAITKFPDSEPANKSAASELAEQLIAVGYRNMEAVEEMVEKGMQTRSMKVEKKRNYLNAIGMIRTSIRTADPKYTAFYERLRAERIKTHKGS